jgi:hypothetical protein
MQKILKINKDDIKHLVGRYIILVNNDDFRETIINNGKVDSFFIEKRISKVVVTKDTNRKDGYILSGFFYPHSSFLNKDELVFEINNAYDKRHYRLLTPKEVYATYKSFTKWMNKYK